MKDDWIYEEHTPGYGVQWKINQILHQEKTAFQELSVVETIEWGRALLLDGIVQVTERDEFIYHEIIAHVPINIHPGIKDVLIIGGGDGGVAKELIKYESIRHIDVVEIDQRVVANCQKYLPAIASGFNDPRVQLRFADGIKYAQETNHRYDLVIIDSSDPIGPATGLICKDFYAAVYNLLNNDGMIVVQAESPIFYQGVFQSIFRNIRSVFPQAWVYLAPVPTYVSGPWAFIMGSKKYQALELCDKELPDGLRYYNHQVHRAAFTLPPYILHLLD